MITRVLFLTDWWVPDEGLKNPGLFVPYRPDEHGHRIKFVVLKDLEGLFLLVAPAERREYHDKLVNIYLSWCTVQTGSRAIEDLFADEVWWLSNRRERGAFQGAERRILGAGEVVYSLHGDWVVERWHSFSLIDLLTPAELHWPVIRALQVEEGMKALEALRVKHEQRMRRDAAGDALWGEGKCLRAILVWLGLWSFE